MASHGYEAGLKMIEELTTNAQKIQQQLLEEILMKNAGTEYLSRFLNGQTDKQHFKNNVPIVTYEDIKPYIDRIANGQPSNILLAEPLTGFFRSSGTSGGQPKLIPATAEFGKKHALLTLYLSAIAKHFGDINQAGKRMELMFTKPDIETPSGLKARSVTTTLFKDNAFRSNASKLYTSPIETIYCSESDPKQSMYCQLLAGLIQRDEVVTVGSAFASTLLRAIKFLEGNWQELCSNIKTSQLSDWITDSECRTAVSLIMKPNSELTDLIENICCLKSWEGIIRKLWPKAKYVKAICTGSMIQYTAELEFYCKGLPLVSGLYVCSEAICGINLEPLSKPSDVSYTFLPNMAYFEFLHVNKDCLTNSQDQVQFNGVPDHESIKMKSKNEGTAPVDLVNVKPGQCYELLVTTSTGLYRYRVGDILLATDFHNSTPQFKFVERQNVILSIDTDKTSESDLLKAVTEAKSLLDPLGFIMTAFTSYGDTSSTPGHYVVFWELKAKEGNNINELDPMTMVECCSRMEQSLGYAYESCRKQNAIAALEIRVVKQGTFDALMDYYVSQGASMSQYKTPSCIKSKEALKILDSRVVGKYFSRRTPL
ncbi:hypothetical protein PTKIN_Ptkin11bG0140100 [Pterospermum kingtungense]